METILNILALILNFKEILEEIIKTIYNLFKWTRKQLKKLDQKLRE